MPCMKDVMHFADMVEGQQVYQLFQYHSTACSPQHADQKCTCRME